MAMKEKVWDYLVIGSGIAGMYFAIKAAQKGKVLLITKTELKASNTYYAQGGIASVVKKKDSFEKHINDTLVAGDELCNDKAVELMVKSAPELISDLIELGVKFTKKNDEQFSLHKEGGHSHSRIFHSDDVTGKEIVRALIDNVISNKNITIKDNTYAIDLLTQHQMGLKVPDSELQCFGAYVLDVKSGEVEKVLSKMTVLATGGAGQVYRYTSNPVIATGDGLAMAYRARASIANIEFFQFHPTTLFTPKRDDKSFLISEAVRGFGGILYNKKGERFMEKYHELKELAPRYVVAHAIDSEMKKFGDDYVNLDITMFPAKTIIEKFPNIYKICLEKGIDITKEMIPVVPAAHYQCGGVNTDLNGKSDIKGLFAIGEVAHTGVHGANRLASNSLLEALVFASRAAIASYDYLDIDISNITKISDWDHKNAIEPQEMVILTYQKNSIKDLMNNFLGVVRSNERLEFALNRIDLFLRQVREYYKKTRISPDILDLRNLADVASLIIRSAKYRKESRGLHFNIDHPKKDNKNWRKNSIIKSYGAVRPEKIGNMNYE